MIYVYCGDGKGKTTASMGLSIRALGNNYKVIFAQFLKSRQTGELKILNNLENLTLLRGKVPAKFSWELTSEEKKEVLKEHNILFKKALALIEGEENIVLVLDEIIGTMAKNLIDTDMVMDFLKDKSVLAEVVLTGRNPSSELIDIADYVSEVKKIKHPHDLGLKARKGIEM